MINHWINQITLIFPEKYSLEHFKNYFYYRVTFFTRIFPQNQQTEEICIEAVNPSKEKNRKEIDNNFTHVVNKTYKVCEAYLKNGGDLCIIPSELLDKHLCDISFKNNTDNIKCIPQQFQDGLTADTVKKPSFDGF